MVLGRGYLLLFTNEVASRGRRDQPDPHSEGAEQLGLGPRTPDASQGPPATAKGPPGPAGSKGWPRDVLLNLDF